ncbi:MAG: lipopolysaccharide biosynthesis protein [Planctomycetota bacterium]|nr:lipopolysaccharide biosynthesis protein [Planctomycetota bacterium]
MTSAPLAPQEPSLTGATARGTAWMIAQSLAGKLVNTVGQVVLTWLLLPEAWGLIGLTYTIVMFGEELRAMGVMQVLVHRQSSYRRWANAAFWMSGCIGVAAGLVMMAASGAVARLYDEPALVGLIAVLALKLPIHALATVPEARLQIDLRFRFLAGTLFVQNASIVLLSVLFAWQGFGAYSFVWPQVIVHLGRTTVLWWVVAPPVRRAPQMRRWRYLIGDSMRIFWAKLAMQVSWQAGYFVLGIFNTPDAVGLFYVGMNFSQQTLRHVTYHLTIVLFPALARLHKESARQVRAYLRACRLLAMVTIPLCLLQAAVAEPLVTFFLAPKFHPSTPLIQILSLAVAARVVTGPSLSMIQAQGRFGLLLVLNVAYALLMLGAVTVAAANGGLVLVALATGVSYIVAAPIQSYVAIRRGGGRWRDVARIFGGPTSVGALACGAGILLSRLIPDVPAAELMRAAVIALVAGAVYLPVIGVVCPTDMRDLRQRVKELRSRRGLRPASPPQTP